VTTVLLVSGWVFIRWDTDLGFVDIPGLSPQLPAWIRKLVRLHLVPSNSLVLPLCLQSILYCGHENAITVGTLG